MQSIASRGSELPIRDADADARYRAVASSVGLKSDDFWVSRYVDFELRRSRYVFSSSLLDVRGKRVLEFGCNVGATAIVLAHLGARVTAIDIQERFVRVARLNAERYGFSSSIDFAHVEDTTRLPFGAGSFDVVSCNSVLEYVPPEALPAVLREVDRVLAPNGTLAILGTSNRLWPKERHSKRWLVNYLPRALDPLLPPDARRRGVTAWTLRDAFPGYEDIGLKGRGRDLLAMRSAMGLVGEESLAMTAAARVAARFGVSIGMLLPSIVLLLRKAKRIES
jgi:2-polyprenyl-3-methyl-5-hydroxy-6-metoxy-1,4-benzoquinol methylase